MTVGADLLSADELIAKVKEYYFDVDENMIKKAYFFALEHHDLKLRESGELYFSHPVEVANILVNIHMDPSSIMAAILHDVVEDTDVTLEQIEEIFGKEVADLVNGVTKISKIELLNLDKSSTENYRKLLIASAKDIRVLLLKLADRLHNMSTLRYKTVRKRKQIAKETLDIYVPLADRIGISFLKNQLQDIAFKLLYRDSYNAISAKLSNLYSQSYKMINTITNDLMNLANDNGLSVVVSGRIKTPYSIWYKINHRGVNFDQIADIIAFRVIVDNVAQCYQMLGIIHRSFMVIPGRFKDYISNPKQNNYQSIHTSIIGPFNNRVEIQIRTHDMHKDAEFGKAAHWNYKVGGNASDQWLVDLSDSFSSSSDNKMVVTDFCKNDVFAKNIFCVTPNGKIIQLPFGSTALDFAYAIHSDIGIHAIHAKIDGIVSTLDTVLENGVTVQIITDQKKEAKESDFNLLNTQKARAALQKALSKNNFARDYYYIKENIVNFFLQQNITITEDDLLDFAEKYSFRNVKMLYRAINEGKIVINDLLKFYNQIEKSSIWTKNKYSVIQYLLNIPDGRFIYTTCCHPVPDDNVVSIINDRRFEIHSDTCSQISSNISQNNIVNLEWNYQAFDYNTGFFSVLNISMTYHKGVIYEILQIVKSCNATILATNILMQKDEKIFIQTEILVHNTKHIQNIIIAIKRHFPTSDVYR